MKKLFSLLVIVFVLVGCSLPEEETAVVAVEPRPLVIEVEEEPINNPVPGTVEIMNPCQESECWSGLLYMDHEDGMLKITVMDAVKE